MLLIPLATIDAVARVRSAWELHNHLQGALELEYSVIPPYLTALFSLRDGTNTEIRELLHSAVVDQMLYVALIANVLNAMGCSPIFSAERLARGYPTSFPLGAVGHPLELRKFSPELVRDVFMAVVRSHDLANSSPTSDAALYGTLGAFFHAVMRKCEELGDLAFSGDPTLQFVDDVSYSKSELFRVTDAGLAVRALGLVAGAEGGAVDVRRGAPLQRIVGEASSAVPYDPSGVINIVENSKAAMYAPGSAARTAVDAFNLAYTGVLADLNDTFNGRSQRYEFAISGMYQLSSLARSIVATDRGDGTFAAPSFEPSEAAAPSSALT